MYGPNGNSSKPIASENRNHRKCVHASSDYNVGKQNNPHWNTGIPNEEQQLQATMADRSWDATLAGISYVSVKTECKRTAHYPTQLPGLRHPDIL